MSPTFSKEIKDFRWSVTTPPRHRNEVYISNGMVGYGVYAKTAHPKETLRLLEFLVGTKGQERMARMAWNIPSNRKVAESDAFLNNPTVDRKVTDIFLEASKHTRLFSRSPYVPPKEFDLYFYGEWDQMMLGKKTPEKAMGDAAKQINQAIRDNMAILGKEPAK
jgi:ABC-type glycerol-3-phosphate transport system substrate-binding protein